MAYIVALTGGVGSGKSTVAEHFARLGIEVIDADQIARQVVMPGEPALEAIRARFGHAILDSQGALNRRALRERIFRSAADKAWLNALLHPLIQTQTQQAFARSTSPYVLWVIPLLIENQLQSQADRILVVDVPPDVQLARTMARDGIDRTLAEQMLNAQVSRRERLSQADDVIDNSGSPTALSQQVAQLHEHYLRLARASDHRKNQS